MCILHVLRSFFYVDLVFDSAKGSMYDMCFDAGGTCSIAFKCAYQSNLIRIWRIAF